ncbi:TrbC/VirB2 family protein [Candidatus Micrarchaeota archaeon]|nr:TrbC/VirB2 family protein [Candidatus Micrarchaeota archaeon]
MGKRFAARLFLLAFLLAMPLAFAQVTPSPNPATVQITNSLCQVVSLVRYVAGAIAILAFAILGIQFMTVGSNPMAREDIKTKMGYIAIGMFLILISNYIVAIFLPQAASCPFP